MSQVFVWSELLARLCEVIRPLLEYAVLITKSSVGVRRCLDFRFVDRGLESSCKFMDLSISIKLFVLNSLKR